MRRRALLAAALAAPWAARAQWGSGVMALPVLPPVVALRPVYAHNPRFPRPASSLLAVVLSETVRLVREHLGLALAFEPLAELRIDDLFAGLGRAQRDRLAATLYDFKRGGGDRSRLVEGTRRSLERSGSPLAGMLAYARDHLVQPVRAETYEALAEAVVETQLARIGRWRDLAGTDGRPLLDGSPYNEYNAWLLAAAFGDWPFEVVVTNQLIASVEYDNSHLHGSLRGGVSNGLCTQTLQSRYGLVSVLSLFPFTSNDAGTLSLRGGVRAEGAEPATWAAALLAHEIGHQLLHLNHPFDRPACVMNPPPALRFREWVAGLDARACPLNVSMEMRPGAVKFTDIRDAALRERRAPD